MKAGAAIWTIGLIAGSVSCGYIGLDYTDQNVDVGGPNVGGSGGSDIGEAPPPRAEGGASALDRPKPSCFGPCQRVEDGLLLLYDFDEGDGVFVLDRSGHEPSLDLVIEDPERTRWVESGLELKEDTMLSSKIPASRLAEAIEENQELTLEAWVHPADPLQGGPSRFFTISRDAMSRNFTLGQDEGRFIARLRTSETNENGLPTLESTPVVSTRLSHVVFTHESNGDETIYLNGTVIARREQNGSIDDLSEDYHLAVGNEFTSDARPWHGTVYLIAVYGRALTEREVLRNAHSGK